MSFVARKGYGVQLSVSIDGGSTYTVVGSLVDGISSSMSRENIDLTLAGDAFPTFVAGQITNSGEPKLTVGYDPLDTGISETLNNLAYNGNTAYWKIDFPPLTAGTGIAQDIFQAHIQEKGLEAMKDKMITSEITLKKTGTPGYTPHS